MWTFHAMGTEVSVAAPLLPDADERLLAARVAALFGETERRFSRFRADSELAALNRARGPVRVSAELAELLAAAGRHVAESGGLFDPTVGAALRRAGYDRPFAPGALDRPAAPGALDRADAPRPPELVRFSDVAIDERARRVARPPHVQLDLGGFLKGRTADRAAALAPSPAAIDAGGDAVLVGAGADGAGWLVDVEDPRDARRTLLTLRVRDRAVATSAANRRRWRAGTAAAHHLIDPRTGAPSDTDLAQVTVVAPTAERADVIAKVVFLRGARDGAAWLAGLPDAAGVLVAGDGAVRLVGELEVADA